MNECLDSPCPAFQVCNNQDGGYTCACPPGYTGAECAQGNLWFVFRGEWSVVVLGLPLEQICNKLEGGYTCPLRFTGTE